MGFEIHAMVSRFGLWAFDECAGYQLMYRALDIIHLGFEIGAMPFNLN